MKMRRVATRSNTAQQSNFASKNWVRVNLGEQGGTKQPAIVVDPNFTFGAGNIVGGSSNNRTPDPPDINISKVDALTSNIPAQGAEKKRKIPIQ